MGILHDAPGPRRDAVAMPPGPVHPEPVEIAVGHRIRGKANLPDAVGPLKGLHGEGLLLLPVRHLPDEIHARRIRGPLPQDPLAAQSVQAEIFVPAGEIGKAHPSAREALLDLVDTAQAPRERSAVGSQERVSPNQLFCDLLQPPRRRPRFGFPVH